jgi:HEAT repeat protein
MLQSLASDTPADLEKLYKLIAERVGCSIPSIDFSRFSDELKALEGQYEKTATLVEDTGKSADDLELRSRAGDKDAIMQLSVSGRPNAFEFFVSILQGSPDAEVRATTVSAIANLNDYRKTAVLGEVLLKERWTVASTCAQALGRSKDESAIPYLIKALDISVDWTVGQKSAEALGFFPPTKESTEALVRAMNRGESFTSEAAMQSLIAFGDSAVPYVVQNLRNAKTFQSIKNSVRVLAILRDKRAIVELENAQKRIPELDAEDRRKQQLVSQIDEAISAINV